MYSLKANIVIAIMIPRRIANMDISLMDVVVIAVAMFIHRIVNVRGKGRKEV